MRISPLLVCLALACAEAAAMSLEDAAERFEAKDWPAAAAAYQEIVDRDPANQLALIRLARSRAANGEAASAIEALSGWFATGGGSYQVAMNLPEFAGLRSDPRFIALVEPQRPCNTIEFRQFDFWVGEWNVEAPASPGTVSQSRITRINDGCTIREEYTTPYGYAGTSLNFYDAARKVWHQTWIDNQGGGIFLEGGLQDKSMVLSTVTDPNVVQRITWTPLEDGRVRQHWESTSDGGKTWTTAFDGYYSRRGEG